MLSLVFFFLFSFVLFCTSLVQVLLIKYKFNISVIIIIRGIICQVTPSVGLSNVTIVKMVFLNVNFTKSTVELYVYCT